MTYIVFAIAASCFLTGVLFGVAVMWASCDRQCEDNYERGFADGYESGAAEATERKREEWMS